jgi:hypothetical protein
VPRGSCSALPRVDGFSGDLLTAFHKHDRQKLQKFIQTGNPDELEGAIDDLCFKPEAIQGRPRVTTALDWPRGDQDPARVRCGRTLAHHRTSCRCSPTEAAPCRASDGSTNLELVHQKDSKMTKTKMKLDEDKALRNALFAPCEPKASTSLDQVYLGLNLPDTIVDPESNSCPLDLAWEVYHKALEGSDEDFSRVMVFAHGTVTRHTWRPFLRFCLFCIWVETSPTWRLSSLSTKKLRGMSETSSVCPIFGVCGQCEH